MESTSTGSVGWDPRNQTFFLYGPDGETEIPVSIDDVNFYNHHAIAVSVNYGAQLGACIMMLMVLLTMSPSLRAVKVSTVINIASLLVSIVRIVLLADYFMTGWADFYAVYTGDYSYVPANDYRISVVANILGVLQLILIEAMLMLQAWTVVKLWANPVKTIIFGLSGVISMLAIAFRFIFMIFQSKAIVENYDPVGFDWAAYGMLVTTCISICYFCALFGARLAAHMWQNRSFLPSITSNTLSAMDVLVMTSAVLMIIPVFFAGLQWAQFQNFESGSLTYTSVVLILPLGILIAQRLATPQFTYTAPNPYGRAKSGKSSGNGQNSGSPSSKTDGGTLPCSQTSGSDKGLVAKAPKKKADLIDVELANIYNDFDDGDIHSGGITVERDFSRTEERA